MADQFNKDSVDEEIQYEVGIWRYKGNGIRFGDRSASSAKITSKHVGVKVVQKCMTKDQAIALLAYIGSNKSMPVENAQLDDLKKAMAHLCSVANNIVPFTMFGDDVNPDQKHIFNQAVATLKEQGEHIGVKTHAVIGAPHIFETIKDTDKFVMFFFNNMDDGHRVKWNECTGKEQEEWIKLFVHHDKTHIRLPDAETIGLKGTNPDRLTDENLEDVLSRRSSKKTDLKRMGVFDADANPKSPYKKISKKKLDEVFRFSS